MFSVAGLFRRKEYRIPEFALPGYQPRRYGPLLELYDQAGLRDADPEKRARYLSKYILHLGAEDDENFAKISAAEGLPAAVNLLEDMVITLHKATLARQQYR